MELIHSDYSFVDDFFQNHFNTGSHYGFLFLINCSSSLYNQPLTQNLQPRRQAGIEKCSRLIAEQKNSRLTIHDFCRQHDLSWHAYYYWLRKIRDQIDPALPSGSAEPQPIFTELLVRDKLPASMPAPPQVATDAIVTIQLTGITISLPATASKATIIKFITAVKEMS